MLTAGRLLGVLVIVFLLKHAGISQAHRSASIAEEKVCADQAQKFQARNNVVTNHYDRARGICFVRTFEQLKDKDEKYRGSLYLLQDAFEQTLYGICQTDANDKAENAEDCWSNQRARDGKKTLKTSDEWLQYTGRTYMSD
jgi:hypothetical protein